MRGWLIDGVLAILAGLVTVALFALAFTWIAKVFW